MVDILIAAIAWFAVAYGTLTADGYPIWMELVVLSLAAGLIATGTYLMGRTHGMTWYRNMIRDVYGKEKE